MKSIIIITIDALRADHLSCLGYPKKTSPVMDKLGENGVIFSQATSAGPSSGVSFMSLFTSTYPLMYDGYKRLSNRRTPLAEVLKENGYLTAGFHSNVYLSRFFGYDRGFDLLYFDLDSKKKNKSNYIKYKLKDLLKGTSVFTPLLRFYLLFRLFFKKRAPPYEEAELTTKRAVSWLGENSDKNFFLWLHYMDVHHPYIPPDKYHRKVYNKGIGKIERFKLENKFYTKPSELSEKDINKLIELYDGEIRYVDTSIGIILKELKKLNRIDDTFIIVTADHGEEFKERGGVSHKANLHEEIIHVPLIIVGPGLPKKRIDEAVSLIDVSPTILDLVGIEKSNKFMGNSLLSLINGGKKSTEGIIAECLHHKEGLISDMNDPKGKLLISYKTKEWKCIFDEETTQIELYNLKNDPKEKENLASKKREKVKEYMSKIMDHLLMEKESRSSEKERTGDIIKKLKTKGKI